MAATPAPQHLRVLRLGQAAPQALPAARVDQDRRRAGVAGMSGVDRLAVNQRLTELIEGFGARLTEDDDDALNELTHAVADLIDDRRNSE